MGGRVSRWDAEDNLLVRRTQGCATRVPAFSVAAHVRCAVCIVRCAMCGVQCCRLCIVCCVLCNERHIEHCTLCVAGCALCVYVGVYRLCLNLLTVQVHEEGRKEGRKVQDVRATNVYIIKYDYDGSRPMAFVFAYPGFAKL